MTDLNGYGPDQALAPELLITTDDGSLNHRARVQGVITDCPAAKARAEGIDIESRSLRSVDLVDLTAATNNPGDHKSWSEANGPMCTARDDYGTRRLSRRTGFGGHRLCGAGDEAERAR